MFCVRIVVYSLLFIGLSGCGGPIQIRHEERLKQAEYHYKLGVAHLQSNNPTHALKELLQAVDKSSQDSAIRAALAAAYVAKKAYPQAEKEYLLAIKLSDDDPRYQNNLASLYLDMGEWDKAITYYELAANNLLFANSHMAFAGMGVASFQKHEYQSALAHYDSAIAIAPGYARAYFLKSQSYLALGDTVKARESLEKAIELAPNYTRALYNLGEMSLLEKKPLEAVEMLERAIESAPDSEWAKKATEMLRDIDKTSVE